MYDAIIIGGGPAGLSAALVLARCCRKILVADHGRPRNAAARQLHGYLTRDGVKPTEILRLGRQELIGYGVDIRDEEVHAIQSLGEGRAQWDFAYRVVFAGGRSYETRKVLLATGVVDDLPEIDGAAKFYGLGVHHCPYCDGWEYRGKAMIAYGVGDKALSLALMLRHWSPNVTLCTQGEDLPDETRRRLQVHNITLRTETITSLKGAQEPEGRLEMVHFDKGGSIPCDAFFFSTGQGQHADLSRALGCRRDDKDQICTDDWLHTEMHGCFIAGDAGGREGADVQFVIQAAAKGATAAVGINRQLMEEDLKKREEEAGFSP
jgi:thioredoxin reductase